MVYKLTLLVFYAIKLYIIVFCIDLFSIFSYNIIYLDFKS